MEVACLCLGCPVLGSNRLPGFKREEFLVLGGDLCLAFLMAAKLTYSLSLRSFVSFSSSDSLLSNSTSGLACRSELIMEFTSPS